MADAGVEEADEAEGEAGEELRLLKWMINLLSLFQILRFVFLSLSLFLLI
jgi:hypothetical protein